MINFIAGEGKPRLMLEKDLPGGVIINSQVSNPGILKTGSRHRLRTGQTLKISGHTGSTPDINGNQVVTVIDQYTITIPVNISVAGFGGGFESVSQIYESTGITTFDLTHAYEDGNPIFPFVQINHRIKSYRVNGDFIYTTFGKVIAKDVGILTIDGWTNGIPTNGQKIIVDGWIIDIPRCQEMTETFEPDYLIHSVYSGDEGNVTLTKFRGYKYECMLDYSKYAQPEMLIAIRNILNAAHNDKVVLIPRVDKQGLNYEVYLRNPFSLTRHQKKGYKKPVFVFAGKRNVEFYSTGKGIGYDIGTDVGYAGSNF
ncbi:MAG: hypothetical protein H3C35_03735 [Bacteroidetes bacterium]|nr:hypothetical protein [Bacteroidota bacterium]